MPPFAKPTSGIKRYSEYLVLVRGVKKLDLTCKNRVKTRILMKNLFSIWSHIWLEMEGLGLEMEGLGLEMEGLGYELDSNP